MTNVENRAVLESSRTGPNIIIMSVAGKPIFVRYEETGEEDWASACSLVQALRANIVSFCLAGGKESVSGLGDIQSLEAGRNLIVFMNTEALTLVAISNYRKSYGIQSSDVNDEDCGEVYTETEAWLRLQLEYVYNQVLFTLTNQVNTIFRRSPNYDLRSMMGPNVNASLRNLLDRFDPAYADDSFNNHGTGCGSFLTAAVECISPISPELRDEASKLLINSCDLRGHNRNIQDPMFGIIMIGTKLVTLVQPSNPSSQLHTSDLHLILTFVGLQPGLLTNELWFPMCLPRFDASGFLYAFTSCLDPRETGLSIVLISPNNSTEQFNAFRYSATCIRKSLGLPPAISNVLRIYDSSSSVSSSTSSAATPIAGNVTKRSQHSMTTTGDLAGDIDRKSQLDKARNNDETVYEEDENASRGIFGRKSMAKSARDECQRQPERSLSSELTSSEGLFMSALKAALSLNTQEKIMTRYLNLASAVHFVFRCDVFMSQTNGTGGGMISQCFGPPVSFPFINPASQNHVWSIYQRLSLRLRLGSSSVETTMDALDMIMDGHNDDSNDSIGIGRDCPMQCLFESPPYVHGVTYFLENNEWLYVGLNGRFFELYATLPGTIAPRMGCGFCARLVRILMSDERKLFLSNPLTWES